MSESDKEDSQSLGSHDSEKAVGARIAADEQRPQRQQAPPRPSRAAIYLSFVSLAVSLSSLGLSLRQYVNLREEVVDIEFSPLPVIETVFRKDLAKSGVGRPFLATTDWPVVISNTGSRDLTIVWITTWTQIGEMSEAEPRAAKDAISSISGVDFEQPFELITLKQGEAKSLKEMTTIPMSPASAAGVTQEQLDGKAPLKLLIHSGIMAPKGAANRACISVRTARGSTFSRCTAFSLP